jgi:hypothetical protein
LAANFKLPCTLFAETRDPKREAVSGRLKQLWQRRYGLVEA